MRLSVTLPLIVALVLLLAIPVQAQLATPSCDALATWAQDQPEQGRWRPSALAEPRGAFPALFVEESTTILFGKPVLEWTPEEARALDPVVAACAVEQGRAGNAATRTLLNSLRTEFSRHLPRYLTALAEARETVPHSLETLASAEGSLPLLSFYLAIVEMNADTVARVGRQVPAGPARDAARALVTALGTLPEAEIVAEVHPVASARIPTLRSELREALVLEIESVEASGRGLTMLDRHAQRAERDYAASLGAEEMLLVEAAIAAQRAAIAKDALETLSMADGSLPLLSFYLALAEIPAGDANQRANRLPGPARNAARTLVAALNPLSETQIAAVVGPGVSARIPALRRALRETLVQEIGSVEASARGLTLLDRHAQAAERDYAAGLGAEEMQRVEAAIVARRAEIGESLRDEIIAQVQATPISVAGAQTLDRIDQQTVAQRAEMIGREGLEAVAAATRERRLAIAEDTFGTLAATEASLPLLSFYLALAEMPVADADQRTRAFGWGPAGDAARTLVAALRPLPEAEIAAVVHPVAAARIPSLRRELREGLVQEIKGVEASTRGLTLLDRHAQSAERDYAAGLGTEEMQRVEAAIVARRAEIGESIRDGLIRQAGGMPLSVTGHSQLALFEQQLQRYPELIGEANVAAVLAAVELRRAQIGEAIRDEIIGQVQATPVGIQAFRRLDEIAPERLLALLPETEARKVRAAVSERRQTVAAELLPQLAALPETDDALLEIEEVILPELERWPASALAEHAPIERAAQERHAAILVAVNRAEAGPLRGRVYEGSFLTVEFIDEGRVVATAGLSPPAAGTYEEIADGRVIVTVNNDAMVFTREGARLISGPIQIRRLR